jgi:acyl-CoA hydrolase
MLQTPPTPVKAKKPNMKAKTPQESFTSMTEIVMPNDTNGLGNLMGGKLLHWMDIAAAVAAQRHSSRVVVTAAVDFVDFKSAIRQNEVVVLESMVTRAFNTSMEVKIDVFAENPIADEHRRHCNTAFYTFVAVDQTGSAIPVNQIQPETDDEQREFEAASERREMRLRMAGKLQETTS